MSFAANTRVRRAVSFARAIVRLYRDRDVPFMAGSIAYAAFISLLPAVLLMFMIASILGGETLQQYVLGLTRQYLTPTSQGVLQESITQVTEQVQVSVVALAALLWAVLKVFRTLDTAFSELYGVERTSSLLDQISDGLVVGIGMAVAILIMIVVGLVFALASSRLAPGVASRAGVSGALSGLPVVELLSLVALVVGLTLSFVPMYYVFPDVQVTVREVLPGAIVAAVGWTLLQGLFQLYISITSTSRLYGVIGGVILFITWLYFGAVILLLGVSTNVVLSGNHRPSSAVAS